MPLSHGCQRFVSVTKMKNLTNEELTKLHRDVAARIEKEGQFWFATTELKGKTWFRINPVNIYTTIETMEALFENAATIL